MYSLSTGGLINSHSQSVGEPTFTRTEEAFLLCRGHSPIHNKRF